MSTSASTALRELLAERFPLNDSQWDFLQAHYDLLRRWNRVLNLTRIEDVGEAAERHYGEALFLASHLPAGLLRIADIGSGAGFPGFPVAVARPDCHVTLVESHQRKSVFLKEASRKLANVRVAAQRAEAVREEFDWVISRAVSYEDLESSLKNLASAAALLTGPEAPSTRFGFVWNEPIRVPGGNQRFLRLGKRADGHSD
jgi:16S rRNA (guanine(527)-N(7))-methyltransferase RsmG